MLAITEEAGGAHHQPRPDVALRGGDPELEPDLEPATASGSSPGRRRCGSTRPASACRCRCSRASTRSARSTHIMTTGYDHTWFVLTQKIIEREFALSGSEQNPDVTGKDIRMVHPLAAAGRGHPAGRGVQEARRGLRGGARPAGARARHEPRDRRAAARARPTSSARSWRATARSTTPTPRTRRSPRSTGRAATCRTASRRVAAPHKLLDPDAGPLIAVRLSILTRKTLGGLETDLDGRVLQRRRRAAARPLRGGRGGGLRRRRHARLPRAGGHVPRRLHLLGAHGRPGAAAAL